MHRKGQHFAGAQTGARTPKSVHATSTTAISSIQLMRGNSLKKLVLVLLNRLGLSKQTIDHSLSTSAIQAALAIKTCAPTS